MRRGELRHVAQVPQVLERVAGGRHGRLADHEVRVAALLDDERLDARAGQGERQRGAGDPAADDDDVVIMLSTHGLDLRDMTPRSGGRLLRVARRGRPARARRGAPRRRSMHQARAEAPGCSTRLPRDSARRASAMRSRTDASGWPARSRETLAKPNSSVRRQLSRVSHAVCGVSRTSARPSSG